MPVEEQFPPNGLMSASTYTYFSKATGIGKQVMGGLANYSFGSGNMFSGEQSSLIVMGVEWEGSANCCWMMHTGCAKIFQSVFNCEDNTNYKEIVDLCQVRAILGPLGAGGTNHGRFKYVSYESVGEKIDLRPYWGRTSCDKQYVVFDYKSFIKDKKDWMFTRPDVFPKFPRVIEASRITEGMEPPLGNDVLTRQPLDIIHILVKYLDNPKAYVNLMNTCRYLRYHAIGDSSFQIQAKNLLLEYYPWAFPTNLEYAAILKKKGMKGLVVDKTCCGESDWLLYMGMVHWTKAMRVRRYVWGICEEVKRMYHETLEAREDKVEWEVKLRSRSEDSEADAQDEEGTGVGLRRHELEEEMAPMFMMRQAMGMSKSELGDMMQQMARAGDIPSQLFPSRA
ncbi:hypothetical protein PQX77_009034 [Marasmius sp. AFHP31]|nr:hypothetical protein PQX77_009034 [Marasmius sp. AFHP31]